MMLRIAMSAALVLTVAGCATTGEAEFGSSVRHMIAGQTFDPDAGRRAPGQVSGLDGTKAGVAVKVYRGEEKQQTESAPMMTFSFSQK